MAPEKKYKQIFDLKEFYTELKMEARKILNDQKPESFKGKIKYLREIPSSLMGITTKLLKGECARRTGRYEPPDDEFSLVDSYLPDNARKTRFSEMLRRLRKNIEPREVFQRRYGTEIPEPWPINDRYVIYGELSSTPLSGRENEKKILHKYLEESFNPHKKDVKRNLIFVEGMAGIGKSRLTYEVLKEKGKEDVKILRGRCLSVNSNPYQPIFDAIGDYIGIGKTTVEKIKENAIDLGKQLSKESIEGGATWVVGMAFGAALGPVGILVGGGLGYTIDRLGKYCIRKKRNGKMENVDIKEELENIDPKRKEEQILDALYKTMNIASKKDKVILLIDDVHWANKKTLDAIHYLSRNLRNNNFSIITTCRTEEVERKGYLTDMQQRLGREKLYRKIELDELGFQDVHNIINYISKKDVSENIVNFIYRETGGNPLYVEEMILHLREEYGSNWNKKIEKKIVERKELDIPSTIKDVVERRLHKIRTGKSGYIYKVLECASAIGDKFDERTLYSSLNLDIQDFMGEIKFVNTNKISGKKLLKCLKELKERHIIRDSEEGYEFTQKIVRQIAYNNIEKSERKNIHNSIGFSVEAISEDSFDKLTLLANHFALAENSEKAYEYSKKAGQQLFTIIGGTEEARMHYKNALKFAKFNEQKVDVLSHLAEVEYLVGESKYYEEAIKDYEEISKISDDPLKGNEARRKKGWILIEMGKKNEAKKIFETNKKESETLKDEKGVAESYRGLGKIVYKDGNYEDALDMFMKALEIFEKLKDDKEIVKTYIEIGTTLADNGYIENSSKEYQKALEIAEKTGDFESLVKINNNIGRNLSLERKFREAYEYYEKVKKISEKKPFRRGIAFSSMNIGETLAEMGYEACEVGNNNEAEDMFAKAKQELENALKLFEHIGERPHIALVYRNKGILLKYQSKWDDSLKYFNKGLEIAEEFGRKYDIADIKEDKGKMLADEGKAFKDNPVKSAECYKKALVEFKTAGNIFKDIKTIDRFKTCEILYNEVSDKLSNI